MTINATISSIPEVRATVNSVPKTRVSINTGATSGGGASQLRQLTDVDATNLMDGNTIVYDLNSDKFVVEELPKINGGNF